MCKEQLWLAHHKKNYWNIRHAPKSIVLVPQVQDASLWGKLIWMIAHIINYCCSLSFSHSFSSFSCVLVGSEIPYTSIPSFLFCSPITTYFAWQSSSLYCPLNHTDISLLCLKLYEAFATATVLYIHIYIYIPVFLNLELLLLNNKNYELKPMCGQQMVLWDAKKWPVMVREPIIAIPLSSQTYSCIATHSWSLILHSKTWCFISWYKT